MIAIADEPFDGVDAAALIAAQGLEMHTRYAGDTEPPGTAAKAGDMTAFLLARDHVTGAAVGCGGLRAIDARTVEIKRMYVVPERRGQGVARALLAALEAEAAACGFSAVRLETGTRQSEAIALYESAGYAPVPCWGGYAGEPASRCYERPLELPSRP